MNYFILYVLKSTLCISLLYLVFRTLMRKEAFFALNRMLLISIVLFSLAIPLVPMPQIFQPAAPVQLLPAFTDEVVGLPEVTTNVEVDTNNVVATPAKAELPIISIQQLLQYGYLAGLLISLAILMYGIILVFLLFRKASVKRMDGFRLVVVERDIQAFSFNRLIILSQHDYMDHFQALLAHEQAHIQMHHFFDLLLLEAVKILHWFNPAIWWLIRDMKEIHEFQADDYTLTKGIDATQYQLLIIQKGVGPQRFALANSFNHCQIKKRIAMINKQKTGKAGSWKAAAFLPLLALLLMAFGRTGESAPPATNLTSEMAQVLPQDPIKQWKVSDFGKVDNTKSQVMPGYCIAIDSKSQFKILPSEIVPSLTEVADHIRILLDYSLADEKTKSTFMKFTINGQERMAQTSQLTILKEIETPYEDYQNLLNTIGNTILEIREKYAVEIFKNPYQNLTMAQRNDIDHLIPLTTRFMYVPKIPSGIAPNLPPMPNDPKNLPLYMVDGEVTDQKRANYFMEVGVEKVIFLNGKEATDKYGEKGKNGVVLITLKQNKAGAISTNGAIGSQVPRQNKDGVYLVVEEMPQFPGGELALRTFIAKAIVYPTVAKENGIQGKVFVTFVVNSNGKVDRAKIARGIDPLLDAEALRVVSSLPDWMPGRQGGEAVPVSYTVPISFGLQSNVKTSADSKKQVFVVVEEMPQFPGGELALRKYITEQIRYPSEAHKNNIQGKVFVTFVINSIGKVDRAKIARGVDPLLDAEAIRVVNSLPDWIPGRQDGTAVDVSYTVPVQFGNDDSGKSPVMRSDMPMNQPKMSIEIRKDGNYIDNKLYSNEELKKKWESWKKENPRGGIGWQTQKGGVSSDRITELSEILGEPKMLPPRDFDQAPEFPGGNSAMWKWIAQNIKYPEEAVAKRIQGEVHVNFIVNNDGKVRDAIVVRGIDPELDAEALRVVSEMPVWAPAKLKGKPISTDYTMPIQFAFK